MGTTGCYGCGGVPVATPLVTTTGIAPLPTGPLIDADPITPGIQANPGVVTPVGPPRVVGGAPPIGFRPNPMGFSNYGAIDADPITPGIQTRPGVVTPMGPPRTIGMSPGRPGFYPAPSTVRF